MKNIVVNGVKCEVVEDLGFQSGYYTKIVKVGNEHKTVVKLGRIWVLWRVPVIERRIDAI